MTVIGSLSPRVINQVEEACFPNKTEGSVRDSSGELVDGAQIPYQL